MFDIGFSEIVLIAVVALLVVGPKEFPVLVRNVGKWVGAIRRAVSSVKNEFDQEVQKAEEIQRLLAREVEIAEAHKNTPPIHHAAIAAPDASGKPISNETATTPGAVVPPAPPAGKQEHGTPQP